MAHRIQNTLAAAIAVLIIGGVFLGILGAHSKPADKPGSDNVSYQDSYHGKPDVDCRFLQADRDIPQNRIDRCLLKLERFRGE